MMKLDFDKESQIFHLSNTHISYVFGVLRNGHLGHYYYGSKIDGPFQEAYFRKAVNRGLTNYLYEDDFSFSLSHERLEYPCFGTTDYRMPAIHLRDKKGSNVVDFKYLSHLVISEKPEITGLPSARGVGETLTLIVTLEDSLLGATLELIYTIYSELPVITRSARLKNTGDHPLVIHRLLSMNLDFYDSDFDVIHLHGDWIKERHVERFPLHYGLQSIGSCRGASSAIHNPFMALARKACTEHVGEAYGISLVYSGNFTIGAEVDSDGHTRLSAGINPFLFQWTLNEGEVFSSPEAVLSYSNTGLSGLSQSLHRFITDQIIHPKYKGRLNQILINNWEATYFDFNEQKLMAIAKEASALGVELFVLDDGWFGRRNSDRAGLGDWYVNLEKLPRGIGQLSKTVHEMGLKFGLWIEPEMVNKDTALFKSHPEWVIGDPERPRSHGRNQFVLDYSRPEVVDAIYEQLIQVLDHASVDYLKWDMNRNITEAFSTLLGERQGELYHRYILGVYALYTRLLARYPEMIIESCAAGGGRFDMGMFYYAPQAWTSDNSDAVERLKIQYGTSMAYPLSAIGAHVTAIPNHQVKRSTSLKLRADVAYFGSFGYELDLTKLSAEDKSEIREQIAFYKANRETFLHGDFYRLISPFEGDGNITAWQVVSKGGLRSILGYYQVLAKPNEGLKTIKPVGLNPHGRYRVSCMESPVSGSFLMNFGILMKPAFNGIESTEVHDGDYQSRLILIDQI